jgi:alpha-glucosidase
MYANAGHYHRPPSERASFIVAVAVCVLAAAVAPSSASAFEAISVTSRNGRVQFELVPGDESGLAYRVLFQDKPVIDTSSIEITLDGLNLSRGVTVGKAEVYRVDEKYPWRGVHSEAHNRCNGMKIPIEQVKGRISYTLEVRAFDDGIAFRHVVPGGEKPRVPDESTAFLIPTGSTIWYHDLEGHYEGVHKRKEIADVTEGDWAGPPLTIKLPDGRGYAAITEAALMNYSGMVLQSDGHRGFRARLGHSAPASYPFRLRYKDDVERLAKPAGINGTITTPWRVMMVGADLNTLVNSDIVPSLAPPPDKALFPDGLPTSWIRPGRCVWKYLDGGESTLEGMKDFSNWAAQLGFEYNLLEGFWQKWSDEQLRDLVTYSKERKVGIWVWKHSRQVRDAAERRQFFKRCQDLGIVGVKLDFFDHEAKEVIDLYQAALRDAAEFHLMVDFHGANKPTGEARTWPNEMTREGVFGLEHRKTESWARHNSTLPFTRFLAGHADYTPVHFGERRRETTWAHQIATAAVFTSPVLIYGANPKTMLDHPGAEMIKSIPSVWDETIALPPSEIGEVAAFARRKGDTWFLAILNGPSARTLRVPLSFLAAGKYQGLVMRDDPAEAAALATSRPTTNQDETMTIELRPAGGFIARFTRSSD